MVNQETSAIDKDQQRDIALKTTGIAASDGDGVSLRRIIATPVLDMLDPFLLLDRFSADSSQADIGGFPDHPHRGFETVTYMIGGCMSHEDNAGNKGRIEPGGVQWMRAGRGIIHSEMPELKGGILDGFQLWVNLPADEKMSEPDYQEFRPDEVPVQSISQDSSVRVVAGQTAQGTTGPVKNAEIDPVFLDITLAANESFTQKIPETHNAFLYVIEGQVNCGTPENALPEKNLGVLSNGNIVEIFASSKASRVLLIAGRRLNEPVARGGPFVMNTKQEVLQAFDDFRQGRF